MSDLASKTHYEILTFDGRDWRIVSISERERDALKQAKATKLHARCSAVKVLRETMTAGDVRTVQIYFNGEEPKKAQDVSDRDDQPLICWRSSDFYSYEGRRLIGILLHNALHRWQVTPSELIHHLPHFQRLENEDQLLKSCVQKTAIDQISQSGETVQRRMRTIFDLIAQATQRLDQVKKAGEIPSFAEGGLESAIFGLKRHAHRVYLLRAALADHLAGPEGFAAKLDILLDMVQHELPLWVKEALDGFLAELLLPPHQIDRLSPEDADPVTILMNAQNLRSNSGPFSLEGFVETPLALEKSILRHIRMTRHFGDGELMSEISGLFGLWSVFKEDAAQPNEFGWQLGTGFSKRSQAILTDKSISEASKAFDNVLDRLDFLMRLESFAIGTPSHRELSKFVAADVLNDALKARLLSDQTEALYNLLRLSQLQKEMVGSQFESRMKNRFIKACDDLSLTVLTRRRVLDQLLDPIESRHEKALKLLELISDGYFCDGETMTMVKARLGPLLKGSRLTEHLLAHESSDEGRAKKLYYIMGLLTKAGFAA